MECACFFELADKSFFDFFSEYAQVFLARDVEVEPAGDFFCFRDCCAVVFCNRFHDPVEELF